MSKISIEVGHGGKDVGAVAQDGRVYEKDVNLTVGLELKRLLELHGQTVLISREDDRDDPVKDFYPKALAWMPDIHISIHTNAFNSTAKGFEVYKSAVSTFKEKSKLLCELIEAQVITLGQTSRGIKDSNFLMSSLPCVSAYCELGFIDNPEDYRQFDTLTEQKSFAAAYAKGIIRYLGLFWIEDAAPKASEEVSAEISHRRETVYHVVTGSYNNKTSAEAWAKILRNSGFESFIISK